MDPADIIAHAASLTEYDLAEIFKAKLPSRIAGYPVIAAAMHVTAGNGPPTFDLHAGGTCVACENDIETAIERLAGKLGVTAGARAAIIRERAAELLAEANALDPQGGGK
jgi:hypothetical protein